MPRRIVFEIPGECVAKGRPNFRRTGKFVKTYTPEKTEKFENLVKLAFINSGCEAFVGGEMLSLRLEIYREIPKSASKKKAKLMEAGLLRPITKPDLDNCVKSVLDGLNQVAFKDDSQIVHMTVDKWYSTMPFARVVIEEIENIE